MLVSGTPAGDPNLLQDVTQCIAKKKKEQETKWRRNGDVGWPAVQEEQKGHEAASVSVFIDHVYTEEHGEGIIRWLQRAAVRMTLDDSRSNSDFKLMRVLC